MAGNDTAALVVALSAQLSKFEKDMQGAVAIADKRTKEIETGFAKLNSAIGGELSKFANSASGQLGAVGAVMAGLGPIGLVVAATIGTLALAFAFVSEKVEAFAEKSKRIKDAAETAGLTVTQFRLLSAAGTQVGLEFEQTEAFVDRLTVAVEELRSKGSGPLFDALLRIDSGLVRQVASAKDTASAVDILATAYHNLTSQQQRNQLVSEIAGKRNIGAGRLLDFVAEQNGLSGLEKKLEETGNKIDSALIERVVKLKREIEEIKRRTDNIYGNAFSEDVLRAQKESAEFWERIAKAVTASDFGTGDRVGPPLTELELQGGVKPKAPLQVTVTAPPAPSVPLPSPRPDTAPVSAAVNLELMKRWTSLLGEAITPAEQLKLKILELSAAQEKGGVSDSVRARALAAFNVAQQASLLATRERLGVATEQQIIDVKLAQLQQDKIKFGLQENEVQTATVVILKEAKLAAEALAVRQAYLPGLKQLELDAQSLSKNLDTAAVSSLNNLGTALGDVVSGTATASDAFRNLGQQVVRAITDMIIRMTILAPIAKGLQATLGGFGGGGLVSGGGFSKEFGYASGTDYAPGGVALVGERGPELVNLPRGSQVIPNDVVRNSGGSRDINVNFSMDLAGANGDETIRRIAASAAQRAFQAAVATANAAAPARQLRYRQLEG